MNWFKIGGYLLIIIPTLFVGVMLGFYLLQDYMIFLGQKLPSTYRFDFSNPYEEIFFHTDQGIVINALLFKSAESKGLVYYHHGNAGNLQGWGINAEIFLSKGWDVLFYDYRGYGKSSQRIKQEKELLRDARFILNEIKQKYNYNKLVYYGNSLGTGVASKLIRKFPPDGLILESPFYSFKELVRHHYPYLPLGLISKYKLRTYKQLDNCEVPVLIFHGSHDRIIPYNQSERLSHLSESINLVGIHRGEHNNLPDFPLYHQELKNFLDKL